MAWEFKHPKYYKEMKKLQREEKNKQATSEQEKQASNQQASRVSSTVDHGPGTTDPQA
jgi:hypothetical protein